MQYQPSPADFLTAVAQQKWQSGRYYCAPSGKTNIGTSAVLGNGVMNALPFYLPNPVTLVRIGGEITVAGDAGSKLRLGIYADDGTARPGALVLDAGVIAADNPTVQEIVIAQILQPGIYWASGTVQLVSVTQPTVRISFTAQAFGDLGSVIPAAGKENGIQASVAGVVGALPAQFAPNLQNSFAPTIFFKVQ